MFFFYFIFTIVPNSSLFFFFFNDTATTEISTLPLHAALPIFPQAWLSLFDTDPAMLDAGTRYLHWVGPVYGVFGLGMGLYFASQGAGRLLWPWLANMVRRSEEHTSELQSHFNLVCRLLLEKKK